MLTLAIFFYCNNLLNKFSAISFDNGHHIISDLLQIHIFNAHWGPPCKATRSLLMISKVWCKEDNTSSSLQIKEQVHILFDKSAAKRITSWAGFRARIFGAETGADDLFDWKGQLLLHDHIPAGSILLLI